MSEPTAKERALHAVQRLPDNATFEDVMECVVLLHKIEIGRRQIAEGLGIPQAEVKAHFRTWWDERAEPQ